jgi:glycosyltransferase involved in cell wall biosynthesis
VNDTSQTETHHCIRFGFIGTLTGTKGIEPLVREFLAADLHNAELWIAGSGKKDYEKQLRNAVTDGRVHFKGRVVPREFYPQVDVVVVPSLWNDNLPGVVFESLAFGKPVIGSRRGGIPEMIRDGENGLLFEPKVPGELADCLRRIHDDAALHARLTANAKPSSTPFMDVQGWVRKYEKLYREVISNSNTQQKK